MKRLLLIIILTLSFQSWTKADDFRDFEIEGMSLGDSALEFFTKSTLVKNKKLDWYKSNEFIPIAELYLDSSKIYESFQIAVKNKDNDFKIQMIGGFVFYKDNVNECYQKIDDITNEIKSLFNNIEVGDKNTHKHSLDKSGKTLITGIILKDINGNEISVQCYDWSEDLPYWDQLRITIDTQEHNLWLQDVLYN